MTVLQPVRRRKAVRLQVDEFQWDDLNESHLSHGFDPVIAEEVRLIAPRFWVNKRSATGTHLMVGPSSTGLFWTVSILRVRGGMWRPITGFPSARWHIERYRVLVMGRPLT